MPAGTLTGVIVENELQWRHSNKEAIAKPIAMEGTTDETR